MSLFIFFLSPNSACCSLPFHYCHPQSVSYKPFMNKTHDINFSLKTTSAPPYDDLNCPVICTSLNQLVPPRCSINRGCMAGSPQIFRKSDLPGNEHRWNRERTLWMRRLSLAPWSAPPLTATGTQATQNSTQGGTGFGVDRTWNKFLGLLESLKCRSCPCEDCNKGIKVSCKPMCFLAQKTYGTLCYAKYVHWDSFPPNLVFGAISAASS